MDQNKLMALLAELTGSLPPTSPQTERNLELLQNELIPHLRAESSNTHTQPFSFENIDDFTLEGLAPDAIERIKTIIQQHSGSLEQPEPDTSVFRIFRREVPVISSQVRGSIPSWARGALPEKTLGPFISITGRRFWFDFFRITKLFPVFSGNETMPSLLVPLRIALFQTSGRIYTIPAGSIWIRSNRIASASAGNLYTGFTIKGGQLEFSIDTPLGTEKITVGGNVTIALRIDLAQPVVNDVSPDQHGIDAKNATLQLPGKFTFQFSSATSSIITVSDSSWNLYGTSCRFSLNVLKSPFWEPTLNRVMIPFNCDQTDFSINSCQSPFIQLKGTGAIIQSAWALTAATIDINNPPAAAGIGAIAIQCNEGISTSWIGLKDNNLYETAFVHFTSAWFMLEPGRIAITDPLTENLQAKQLYKLWADEPQSEDERERRSTVEITFNKKFQLIYNAYQKGDEAVIAVANTSINADRPVKAEGIPFELKSKNSWYILAVNQQFQSVGIYDDNILFDTKKPEENLPTFTASAIALHNALLLVSPVAGFGLFGELLNENTFDRGILATSHGLLSYLPTLPDPYAANIGFFRRQRGIVDVEQQRYTTNSYSSMLVAMVGWPTPGAAMPHPVLSFHFAPKPEPELNSDTFRLHNSFTTPPDNVLTDFSIDSIKNKRVARRLAGQISTFKDFNRTHDERPEFLPEINDYFSLVDVSTNADWMGIAFGLTDDNFIFRRTHMPNPAIPDGNPLKINGLDVVAPGKFVRAYTTPLISWEPVFNISPPPPPPAAPPVLPLPVPLPDKNPPVGFLFFENDGGPTRIFNSSVELVTMAPIPVTEYIVDNAKNHPHLPAWLIFTLPFGIRSLAIFYKDSFFYKKPEGPNNGRGVKISMNSPEFKDAAGKIFKGGMQLKITGAEHPSEGKIFEGASYQNSNIVSITGTPTNKSILGTHVTHIFNSEFGRVISEKGVPVERIDVSGYGANIFSNWLNPYAAFGKTSQARFDVFKGRTAHEVIQVKSIIYPWAIKVVRTITIYRTASAYTYRHDSGWIAESDGVYDFSNWVYPEGDFSKAIRIESPYVFHPGIIRGVYNIKNIVENELLPFTGSMPVGAGQKYIHEITGEERTATAAFSMNVLLAPVYFDANVLLDFVIEGKVNDKVPSKKMLGYVQLNPLGQPISPPLFKSLLLVQQGSLGGAVDCLVNIGNSNQKMRINRVDVNASVAADNINPVFASAAKGTVVLPKDGSWSIVKHTKSTDEITPVSDNNSIPLLKEGILSFGPDPNFFPIYPTYNSGRFKLANPEDLLKNGNDAAISYAFLQNTDTQKVLFKNPEFELNQEKLLQNIQSKPKLADAYRLLNSPGIFPKLKDVHDMDLSVKDFEMKVIDQGYKLLHKLDPAKKFEQTFPIGPWFIVKEEKIKIYIEYAATNRDKVKLTDGVLNFDIDSAASKWLNKMNDITMVVDLLSFERMMLIRGKFDAEKGKHPSFIKPELEFGKDLDPAVKILRILAMLSFDPDYKEILQSGLKIVMSNSPENWEYKFQADKEIPVLKFPPTYLDGPTTPLRLEAGLKIGCYFNMALPLPPASGITAPTAGAFVEFYGKLSVMCVSLAAATIYAVGTVRFRLSADTKAGPGLDMKFAFGVELMVGLPVVGNVSVTYGVGVEMHFDSNSVVVGALIFFRGRAELIGGLITVTIYIEAAGKIERTGLITNEAATTNCIAQVTFALDITICFVIDISFEEKWQESKQIA